MSGILLKLLDILKWLANGLSWCLSGFYGFVAGSFFQHVVAFLSFLVALFVCIRGGKKVSELLKDFQHYRREAVFGYYTNLRCYLKRLRALIADNNGEHIGTLNLLSGNKQVAEKGGSVKGLAIKLSKVSNDLLNYLSTQSRQFPPGTNKEQREAWGEQIDSLILYLNEFSLMEDGITNPGLESVLDVQTYFVEIMTLFEKIERMVKEDTNLIMAEYDEAIKEE